MNGTGTFTYVSGAWYTGNFENSVKSGEGCYTFSNGSKYKGEFADGNMQGTGVVRYKNGDTAKCEYKDGRQTRRLRPSKMKFSTGCSPSRSESKLEVPTATPTEVPTAVSLLFRFPEYLILSILIEWLLIEDLAHLDSAICHRKTRSLFLSLLRSEHPGITSMAAKERKKVAVWCCGWRAGGFS